MHDLFYLGQQVVGDCLMLIAVGMKVATVTGIVDSGRKGHSLGFTCNCG